VCNAARDTGIVATCGGDTVCLIDCGTGQVMKRFKQQKEVCMSMAYLLLGRIAVLRMEMRPIVTDQVAWWSVGLSVCHTAVLSPAKTAEPIKMPFELRSQVGPVHHVLDGGPDPRWEGALCLRGKGSPIVKYKDTAVICAITVESIEMPFGLWAQMGPRNRNVLDGSPEVLRDIIVMLLGHIAALARCSILLETTK